MGKALKIRILHKVALGMVFRKKLVSKKKKMHQHAHFLQVDIFHRFLFLICQPIL